MVHSPWVMVVVGVIPLLFLLWAALWFLALWELQGMAPRLLASAASPVIGASALTVVVGGVLMGKRLLIRTDCLNQQQPQHPNTGTPQVRCSISANWHSV